MTIISNSPVLINIISIYMEYSTLIGNILRIIREAFLIFSSEMNMQHNTIFKDNFKVRIYWLYNNNNYYYYYLYISVTIHKERRWSNNKNANINYFKVFLYHWYLFGFYLYIISGVWKLQQRFNSK